MGCAPSERALTHEIWNTNHHGCFWIYEIAVPRWSIFIRQSRWTIKDTCTARVLLHAASTFRFEQLLQDLFPAIYSGRKQLPNIGQRVYPRGSVHRSC